MKFEAKAKQDAADLRYKRDVAIKKMEQEIKRRNLRAIIIISYK